jgi:hypothetical protein
MTEQVLFKYKEYVQLWQTGGNVPNINGPMIQYYSKVYKGATNTIDFVVRNNDRQPVNLVGYQIEALIQRVENPEILLIKTVEATDDRGGKCRLVLDNNDINVWLPGSYRYSIRLTHVSGRLEFLCTDINRSTTNTFELIEGMEVSLAPATEILGSQFTPFPLGWYDNTWSTGSLAGNTTNERLTGMNTVVAYTTRFVGRFWIQASISNTTPDENEWFDIQLTPSTHYYEFKWGYSPCIKVFNFTGNYNWIRMFYHKGTIVHGQPFAPLYYPESIGYVEPVPYYYIEQWQQDWNQLHLYNQNFLHEGPCYPGCGHDHHYQDYYYQNCVQGPQSSPPQYGSFDKVLYKN